MNFKKYITIGLLIFPFILSAKRAPDRPDWLKEELKKFRFREAPENCIIWNNINEKVKMGSPEEMAKEFLIRHKRKFGFKEDLSDLKLKRPPHGAEGVYRVEFYQVYEDIPLYDNEVIVILKEDGTILSVISSYLPNLEIDTKALISQHEAIDIALNYLRIKREEIKDTILATLMIFPCRGKRLVWKVVFHAENPLGWWHIYIDAKNGEIVHLEDKSVYYSGYGYVFKPDPITTGYTYYGAPGFVDNNDYASYQLNQQRKEVTLLNLKYENGYYYLEDPLNVTITNFSGYSDPRYSSSTGNFYYTRYDQGFEAVCAFYHIRTFQDYLRQIGFGSYAYGIYIDPHATYDDQSWYEYENNQDRIYFGEGGVDDAEDADVIIHEFGHCLERRMMGGFNYNYPESGALSEGYADYFAGSYSVRAAESYYQKDWVFNWDGHNEFWDGRILNSTKHYPESIVGEPHEDGEIFSACLWKIWEQYGPDVADKLTLMSLMWLWSAATFKYAAKQVLEADYFYYPSSSISHAPFIRQVFYDRGILIKPQISIAFPQGGEKFVVGSVELLQWVTYDPDHLSSWVDIYYYNFQTNQWIYIASTGPLSQSYFWYIPENYTGLTKIKVELKDKVYNVIAFHTSDVLYIVPKPSLTITFPNGGEIFNVGSTINITWTSSDPNNVIKYLKIYFSSNGGQSWTLIADNVQNIGSYSWQVPQTPTLKGKIKIEAYNERSVLIQKDESDGNFTIVYNSITLLWPNSPSITIEEKKTYYIKYNGKASFGIQKVTAWLSYDSGQTFPDSVGSRWYGHPYPKEVSGHTIEWFVTQAPTLHGRIKVILKDSIGLLCEDISDYDFKIIPARPTNLQATSSYPYNSVYLTWKDNSNYETGYEVWRKGLDNIWKKIATLGQNAQSYTDASISKFNDYLYKVKAVKGNITSEFSNTCWVTTSPILLSKDKVDTFYFNDGKGKKIIYKNGKWHSVFNTGKRVYYSYSNDNGLTWNTDTIVKINLPNRWVEDACLAIDDQNRIWVFYEYNGPSNFKIKYRVKAGNNWSEEDSIQRYGKNPCAFSLNGSVYLVFESPIDKEGIKVYMCEFSPSGSLNIDSLRERWIGKGSISGSYFENIFLSAQYGSSSPNMYHSLMYYKWGMNAFDSIQIDNKIIKEYNRQHFVDKNVLCFLEKKYAEDIESLRVIKYNFSDNKWEWFISQNFQRMRFPAKIKNPRIFYDGADLFIIYERDSLNYYYIEGFRITNNGGLIRYRFSILPSTIKTYPDIYIYKDINKIHLGIMYNSSEGIIFKRKEIPFAPPPIPEPIDENISLLDIPSNNSQRISLFDNSLHILYSKNDSVFDAILKDNEILKKFLGYGKNPSLFSYKGNLYTIWAYNDTTGLEEIRFSKYDTSWSEIKSSYRALNTNYFGIGAPSFYIENDTGYVAFESTKGTIAHILPAPPFIPIIKGKNLISYKFPLNNPLNYEILYEDFIPEWIEIPPMPIETVRIVPKDTFYKEVVPILISPSIVSDKGISNIIWDGINKFLKIYKIGNDTIVKIIYPEYGNVKDPYAFKENSIVKFLWVEYDSLNSSIYTSYTLKDKEISEKRKIYEGYKIKEPFSNRNYIVFVENDGFYDNLVFGEIKTPFEKEILFTDKNIRSPQILYDETKNKFYITFYSSDNDSVYNLYKIEKEITEPPPDLTFYFGSPYKEPITIYREGYISLGEEDYKNLDFGDSLIYEIPLYYASKVRIKFEAYLNKEVKEKIYINNHPVGVWHIKENQHEIYEKQIVPPILDSILRIKIEKKQGDKVYLGKLSIYIQERKGGIQGSGIENILRFSLNISPNIIKDKGILEIIIPQKEKINLSIYDVSGRKTITLIDDFLNPGIYKIKIDSKKFKKGIDFAVLKGKEKKIKKFVILE